MNARPSRRAHAHEPSGLSDAAALHAPRSHAPDVLVALIDASNMCGASPRASGMTRDEHVSDARRSLSLRNVPQSA